MWWPKAAALALALGLVLVASGSVRDVRAEERFSSSQAQLAAVRIASGLVHLTKEGGRVRRGSWDDHDDGPNFETDDDGPSFSCLATTKGIAFLTTCVPPLTKAVQPFINDLTQQLSSDCLSNPVECETEDFADLEDSLQQFAQVAKAAVQALCDESDCWSQLLNILPECINPQDTLELPDLDLYVDQLLGAAEVVCTHDQNGDSCGVKLLEFALIENELLDSENESTFCQETQSDDPTCSDECQTLLSSIDSQLGCCYAEVVSAMDNLPDDIVDPDMLLDLGSYWSACHVEAPIRDCSNHKVPAVTGGSSHSHGSGDFFGNLSLGELIGMIAGAVLLLLAIVGGIIVGVGRSKRSRQIRYAPVNTHVDDAWRIN